MLTLFWKKFDKLETTKYTYVFDFLNILLLPKASQIFDIMLKYPKMRKSPHFLKLFTEFRNLYWDSEFRDLNMFFMFQNMRIQMCLLFNRCQTFLFVRIYFFLNVFCFEMSTLTDIFTYDDYFENIFKRCFRHFHNHIISILFE